MHQFKISGCINNWHYGIQDRFLINSRMVFQLRSVVTLNTKSTSQETCLDCFEEKN
jgi:hypothetical protein